LLKSVRLIHPRASLFTMRNIPLAFACLACACSGHPTESRELPESQKPEEAIDASHRWHGAAEDAEIRTKSPKALLSFLLAFNPATVPKHTSLRGLPLVSNPSPARRGVVLASSGTPKGRARAKRRARSLKRAREDQVDGLRQKQFQKYSMEEPSRRMLQVASFLQQRMTDVVMQCAHRNSVGMKRIPPSVDPKNICITRVDVAPNLMNANIHVAVAGDRKNQITTMRWLRAVTPVLRYEFGATSGDQLRKIPELRFVHDDFGKTDDFKELLNRLADEAEDDGGEFGIDDDDDEDMPDYNQEEMRRQYSEYMNDQDDGFDQEFWDSYYETEYSPKVTQEKKDKNLKDELLEGASDDDEDAWLIDESTKLKKEKQWIKDEEAMWEDTFEDEFEEEDDEFEEMDGDESPEQMADRILGRKKKKGDSLIFPKIR